MSGFDGCIYFLTVITVKTWNVCTRKKLRSDPLQSFLGPTPAQPFLLHSPSLKPLLIWGALFSVFSKAPVFSSGVWGSPAHVAEGTGFLLHSAPVLPHAEDGIWSQCAAVLRVAVWGPHVCVPLPQCMQIARHRPRTEVGGWGSASWVHAWQCLPSWLATSLGLQSPPRSVNDQDRIPQGQGP